MQNRINLLKPYAKNKQKEAKAQIRAYEEEIAQFELARLKNADTEKRDQLVTKRNRVKEITEDLIPVLEKRIEDLRSEENQHVNHKEDLLRRIQDLKYHIRKFGFEMDKAKGDYERLKKRQDKAQVGFHSILFGVTLCVMTPSLRALI